MNSMKSLNDAFLKKYNPKRTLDKALSSGFTGRDLVFEEPQTPDLVLDTVRQSVGHVFICCSKKLRRVSASMAHVLSGHRN